MKKHLHTFYFHLLCLFVFILNCILLSTFYQNDATVLNLNASTNKNEQTTIVIDAGHGGYDVGSMSEYDDYEKDITLSIALKTGALLEEYGFKVIYTRDCDEVTWSDNNEDDLQTRVAIGVKAKADYFISIHLNASNYNDGANGFEIYTDDRNKKITSLAKTLETQFDELNYTNNRGIKSTADRPLHVVDDNSVPALLIELGFITDRDDLAYMLDSEGQHALAACIANSMKLQA